MDCTASRTSAESSRGTIRIAGSSTTSAPSARSAAARPLAWARARVTTTRRAVQGAALQPGDRLAPRRHRAGEHDRRRADRRRGDRRGQLGERRGHGSLARHRPPLDSSRRLAAVAPRRDQALGHLGQPLDAHVEDERPGKPGERLPVERRVVLGGILVPGDEGDRRGVLAVGQRDAGVRRRGDPGGDARARPRTGFRPPPAPRPPRRRARRRTGRRPSGGPRCVPPGHARPSAARSRPAMSAAPPGRLPTSISSASGRAPSSAPGGIRRSWRITSALASSSSDRAVIRPGSPGPAPTR